MYDPLMANLTCIFGQMIILDLIAHVEPYSRLLQTNTDGIFVLCENEEMKEKVIEVTNEVGKRLSMEFEIDEFCKLIQKDVNNYIAIDINGKAECKGSFVKYNTPIDNDLPILNDAVREYLINGTPVEDTINNCTDLIKFQKVIKLSAKYNEVWYGKPIQDKISSNGEIKTKIASIDGKKLKEKVHRVFASTNKNDGRMYKLKVEKGSKSYEKFGYTPENLFIDNSDIHEKPIPEYLDREYYINEAKKRINMFLVKDEIKEDNTPEILYKCMIESDSFYDFLVKRKENNISDKVLREYILADCCKVYGKAGKLLSFMDYYFKGIYGLKLMRVTTIDKKYPEYKDIIMSCGENKTGKTITSFDYEKCLKRIFDVLPDEDIHPYVKMSAQIGLFNTINYTDEKLNDNVYFILNVRNVIVPNLIMYNMKTGEFEYRKIDKDTFSILPLYDGDIIEVTNQREEYAMKIMGKDGDGINIVETDTNKKYNLITSYEILYRHYGKNTKLISDCEDN